MVPPQTAGPRIRLGALWFFLALAAVTSGRWWTAALSALVAAAAAFQTGCAWGAAEPDEGSGRLAGVIAAPLAAAVPLAAGYGTGLAGAALVVVAAFAGALMLARGRELGSAVAIAAVLPAVAASSIVLALQVDLWVALFLVLAVSLFDAGNFLLGAEAAGRWEGPVAGAIGALAVTFTVATVGVAPLERAEWWLAGVVVAATCAVGQWVTSLLLPEPDTWVPALRRLDAYVVAGPALVALVWALGG